ncbi:Uncharacterised protein [uncultured archaeon]|nr:Uncharacterised protein [uncultured archaeon]
MPSIFERANEWKNEGGYIFACRGIARFLRYSVQAEDKCAGRPLPHQEKPSRRLPGPGKIRRGHSRPAGEEAGRSHSRSGRGGPGAQHIRPGTRHILPERAFLPGAGQQHPHREHKLQEPRGNGLSKGSGEPARGRDAPHADSRVQVPGLRFNLQDSGRAGLRSHETVRVLQENRPQANGRRKPFR